MDNRISQLSQNLLSNFYHFYRFFWPLYSDEKLILSKHIKYICDELQKIGISIINREKPEYDWTIINIPPGSSKSSMVSVLWPCWLLANDPTLFIINSSYSGDLSTGFVRKSLSIIKSESFKQLFGEIKFEKETESYFETIQHGGRYATSTGGTITGVHGNVVINDDPLSVEMSWSKAGREKANRFSTTTLTERVRDKEKTPQIVVMQRLHEDDVTGHILNKGVNLKHICLPAELSTITTKGLEYLYTDGLIDPVRIGKDVCEKKKKELGSTAYAGQYDQNPHPEGGNKIKGAWFPRIHEKELPSGIRWDLWVDGAYTKQTENDPTGCMIAGFYNGLLYIKKAESKHLEMPELLNFIPIFAVDKGLTQRSYTFIEPKASGLTLKQLLKSQLHLNPVSIEGHLVSEGKEARIQTAAPKCESERVILVTGAWNDDFIGQLEGFPTAKHDEYVDLLGYAVDFYFKPRFKSSVNVGSYE